MTLPSAVSNEPERQSCPLPGMLWSECSAVAGGCYVQLGTAPEGLEGTWPIVTASCPLSPPALWQ